MAPETERILKLADDYASTNDWIKVRCALEDAVDALVSECDSLSRWRDAAVNYGISLQRAIEARCRGQKVPIAIAQQCPHHAKMLDSMLLMGVLDAPATSEPAKPRAVPSATAEPEATDDYDLVDVKNNGEAWRYKRGCNEGERTRYFPGGPWSPSFCTRDFPILGTKFTSMADAVRWWRETHPEPAERAEPAKPTLRDRLAEMRHEVDGILKRGGSSHITEIINAIHAVALVVDGVANSHKAEE